MSFLHQRYMPKVGIILKLRLNSFIELRENKAHNKRFLSPTLNILQFENNFSMNQITKIDRPRSI